jgi:peptide/nickel transport system substrate-binding protein
MNKEPLFLYISRFLVSLGILFFLVMIYWSSALQEQDMQSIRSEVAALRTDVNSVQDHIKRIAEEGVRFGNPVEMQAPSNSLKTRSQIDPSLPNLMDPDPFYEKTLPELLGPNFKPLGIIQGASTGKYDNLLPFADWAELATWNEWCSVAVAKQMFGKYETFTPDMAIKMEERKSADGHGVEYWIHLRDNVFWQPLSKNFFPSGFDLSDHFLKKHPVTADDFKFYFDAVMNPYISAMGAVSLRPYLQDIIEFRVVDKLTFVVRWKEKKFLQPDGKEVFKPKYVAKLLTGSLRPLASFVYQYYPNGKKIIENDKDPEIYRKDAIWAQGFNQHWARNIIVSCGPWLFDGRTDRQINFKRNRDFYFPLAALVEGREIQFKESPDNVWQDFKGNKLTTYSILPDQLLELQNFLKSPQYAEQVKQNARIKRLDFFSRSFTYIGWNEKKPFFKSAKIRRALTMAIDRQRIIQQYLNGMAMEITGPLYPFDKAYDKNIKPWPYDVQKAKQLLEEEGWYDHNGDGIIDKVIDGQDVPFRFTLTYISRSTLGKNIAEFIATSLKEIGIDARTNGLDIPDITAKINDKNFDALLMAWSLGSPPDDPRQIWYTDKGDEKGSSNYIGFSNQEVDKIIDQLDYESDPQQRIELYHRFQQIIHEEAPYIFLDTPKTAFLYREKLQNVFIPADHQDLVPGADVAEPDPNIFWLKEDFGKTNP